MSSRILFHAGRGMGAFIEPMILDARQSLYICSPWISLKYAQLLTKRAEEGIEVRIITSNDRINEDTIDHFEEFINKYKPTILGTLFSFVVRKKEEEKFKPNFFVLIPEEEFFHGKVYIADEKRAIVGSANLTESGLFNNIEYVIIMEGMVVREVVRLFKMLWERILSMDQYMALSVET